jgi:hypothetical protein
MREPKVKAVGESGRGGVGHRIASHERKRPTVLDLHAAWPLFPHSNDV